MPLAPGTKLGPYEILTPLGAGGMGEVYRASDPRLGRDVAIKVSAAQFSERFEREARAVAALNHANICTLFDVGPNYLVMELVEGPTLADRLAQGPIPIDEALRIAAQIAEALDAAHEKGITHRDLKPANVKIRPDGTVKVLDFGLAKVGTGPASSPEHSPTLTMGATLAGVILGTAGYMSPEQARGEPVDKRADIWAYGVVLHEMLTGKRLFDGKTVSDTLAAVLLKEPKLDDVPPKARRLVAACLERDLKRRLRDIGEAWRLLEDVPAASTPFRRGPGRWTWPGAAALCLVALAAVSFFHFREAPPANPERVSFPLLFPDKVAYGQSLSISPDGRRVAFIATSEGGARLWVHSFDSLDSHPLAGTENVFGSPFWSPDSRTIVFAQSGKLRRVEAAGGPPQTLCDLSGTLRGGFWTRDGRIVFATDNNGLRQVAAGGGASFLVTDLDKGRQFSQHLFPVLLPDGRHFLYLRRGGADSDGIYLGSLGAKPNEQSSQRLLADDSSPAYVAGSARGTGHLLFVREGSLMAQPFDASRLEFTGDAVPIAETVGPRGQFTASANGVLVYATGSFGQRHLVWYDRHGMPTGTVWMPGEYNELTLSPDGKQVAVVMTPGANADTWTYDFSREASTRVTLTFGVQPIWSPDGSRIAFRSLNAGSGLYARSASGSGDQELLLKTDYPAAPKDWSRDGRFLLYEETNPKTKSDLWVLPMQGDRKPVAFLHSEFDERNGKFSPDGRFVTYLSNESGKDEVYVSTFPASNGGKWSISSGGGFQPRWRADGKELLYLTADGKLMSVDVTLSPTFKASAPKVLFQTPVYGGGTTAQTRWDISPDGQKFLINTATGEGASFLSVILNWQEGLRK